MSGVGRKNKQNSKYHFLLKLSHLDNCAISHLIRLYPLYCSLSGPDAADRQMFVFLSNCFSRNNPSLDVMTFQQGVQIIIKAPYLLSVKSSV